MKVKLKKHDWSKWKHLAKPKYGEVQSDGSILTICKRRYLWLNGVRVMYLIEYPHKDANSSFATDELDLSVLYTEIKADDYPLDGDGSMTITI